MAQTCTISQLVIGDIISFNTYGTGTVNNVSNGTLLAFESGAALRNPTVAAVNHANIYSSLPIVVPPTSNDYTKYNYLLIQLSDNSIIEIGEPWIDPISLTRLVRQTATIILTDFDASNLASLSELLQVNGYTSTSITLS